MYAAVRMVLLLSVIALFCSRADAADQPNAPVEVTASAVLDHPKFLGVYAVTFVAGGESLLTSDSSSNALWDIKTAKRKSAPEYEASGQTMFTSPDGKLAAVTDVGSGVAVIDSATGKSVQSFRHSVDGFGGNTLCWSRDSKRIASTREKATSIWDLGSEKDPLVITTKERGQALAFSPDASRLATVTSPFGGPGTVVLADSKTGKIAKELSIDCSKPAWIFFLSDKALIVPNDKGADVLDIESGKLKALVRTDDAVKNGAVSADGRLLALASDVFGDKPRSVTVWNVSDGRQVATLKGHTDKINALAFSPNGTLLATASSDKTARLWPLPKP